MSYIQGIPRDQLVLYSERLDDVIASDDPARLVDAFCRTVPFQKLGFSHAVAALTGRPAYDPAHMLSLLIWGFMNGVTSSRKLEHATKKNISVMWLLERVQPDFKTISEFRRANVGAIPLLMRECTKWMRGQQLLGGELVAIDGSKFRASNGRGRNYTEKTLAAKQARIEAKIKAYLEQLEREDAEDEQRGEDPPALTADQIREAIARLNERKDFYDAIVEQMHKEGVSQVSLTDPDSRSMKTNDGINICYNAQIAVDGKHGLIVAESVTNEVNDEKQLYTMAAAAKKELAVEKLDAVADGGYVNSTELAKCEADGITAYVPALTMPKRDGKFSKDAFRYDAASDSFTCPAGHVMTHSFQAMDRKRLVHYYRTDQCRDCPLRPQCTSSHEGRRIARRDDEKVRHDAAERSRSRPDLMRRRQQLVEHPFGTIKRQINHGYFQLRGLAKVGAEFALAALAFNFKRILTLCPVAT